MDTTKEAPDTMLVDRDEEISVKQAKKIVKEAVGANYLYPKMYDVLGKIPYHNLLIGISEALQSAREEGAESVVDAVYKKVMDDSYNCPSSHCCNCGYEAARAAYERIKGKV